MALWKSVGNGTLEGISRIADLDASKLTITLSKTLKPIPHHETLLFGNTMTDHMLVASFDSITGWSAPEIRPHGPLSIDPASSCIQYGTTVFEGMKAYIGPDGEPRLFRPDMNMARLARSAERMALPPFNTNQVLALIKQLIIVDRRWIPLFSGYSLYVRPTLMGTRMGLSVAASDAATLCIVLSPGGPYFRSAAKAIPVLAVSETVRAWPGGTGGHKVALNYSPGFLPLRIAQKQGYEQILWLLGDDMKITEAGAMNCFVCCARDDGDIDLLTPPLDGTILPGVTRDSVLALAKAYTAGHTTLPGLEIQGSHPVRIHAQERTITMAEMASWNAEGKLLEAFGAGTAVIIASIGKIGWKGDDLVLPVHEGGLGPVAKAFRTKILDIQEGRDVSMNWSVLVTDL